MLRCACMVLCLLVCASIRVSAIDFGETSSNLSSGDSGNANLLVAMSASLSEAGTLQSLSFYVNDAFGMLVLALYDASGDNGMPGVMIAETAPFTPVGGWNTQLVLASAVLQPGSYWLAFRPESSSLSSPIDFNYGSYALKSLPWGSAMPSNYGTPEGAGQATWPLYGTVSSGSPPAPASDVVVIFTQSSANPIQLQWDDNEPSLADFELFRNEVFVATVIDVVEGTGIRATSDVAPSGTSVCYKVRATDGTNFSAFSNEVCTYVE